MRFTKDIYKERKIKLLHVSFMILIILGAFFTNLVVSNAYASKTGVVNGSNVYVRTGAGTGNSIVNVSGTNVQLHIGKGVTVEDEASASDGYTWYKITFDYSGTTVTGWMRGDFITITSSDYTPDADFEAYLTAQGFPDSYKEGLRALHSKYPNWAFQAVKTGLNWSDVIANESKIGVNLTPLSGDDSTKSTDPAAYNWASNSWYGFDTANWVCASPSMISYCMDPRNFLDEINVFQFATLHYASYQTAAGVNNVLANTFMSGTYRDADGASRSYADTFVAAGSNSGVNPYHLAARARQEQGTAGTSGSISGTYSGYAGYFNYFNIGASPGNGNTSIVNGLVYAKNQGWNTRYKSIVGGASFVANKYVNIGQDVLYFQKFNVVYTPSLYSHQYMTNVQAAISEGQSLKKAYTDYSQPLVFRIPVYNNMPVSSCAKPNSGNPNNWLSSLSVSGYSLTPSFSGSTTEYSMIVGENVSSVSVNAAAVASTSGISGTGNVGLNYGANNVSITCKAQDGSTKVYTINITREEPKNTPTEPATEPPTNPSDSPSITSPYKLDTYATGFTVGSSSSEVLGNIQTKNCTVKILNADGSEHTGVIATGNVVAVYENGAITKKYPVVIYGDLNGDGKISNVDLVLMKRQILGLTSLDGAYLLAADINKGGDGAKNLDLVMLKRHILGLSAIAQ